MTCPAGVTLRQLQKNILSVQSQIRALTTMAYFNAGGGGFANALNNGKPVVVQGQAVNSQQPLTSAQPYNTTDYSKPDRPARGCRDALWAILFYVHIAAMIFLAVAFTPQVVNDMAANVNGNRMLSAVTSRFLDEDAGGGQGGEEQDIDVDPQGVLTIVLLAGILGLVIATLALGFMISFAEVLIKLALWFNIILFGVMALLSLLGGAVGGALMFGLFCAFSAYYAYCVWARIPFAASNLVTAVTAVRANLGLAFYAYWSLIVLFGWSMLWSISTMSTLYVLGDCNADGECQSEINGGFVFLFLLSYYWTAQVIQNVVHVTVAGTVGHWWDVPNEASSCCSKAVRDSYLRSLTTSFGSICLGSLIVALIQAARAMVESSRENGDSLVGCCADFLLGCLERLVEYFNKWAYVYVGLYGKSTHARIKQPAFMNHADLLPLLLLRLFFYGSRLERHDSFPQPRLDSDHC